MLSFDDHKFWISAELIRAGFLWHKQLLNEITHFGSVIPKPDQCVSLIHIGWSHLGLFSSKA